MTTTITFQGYSDDTFGVYFPRKSIDYDNCAAGTPIRYTVTDGKGRGLYIFGQYDCRDDPDHEFAGGWIIGIAVLDGDNPPGWECRLAPDNGGYQNSLTIYIPHGDIKITCLENRLTEVIQEQEKSMLILTRKTIGVVK